MPVGRLSRYITGGTGTTGTGGGRSRPVRCKKTPNRAPAVARVQGERSDAGSDGFGAAWWRGCHLVDVGRGEPERGRPALLTRSTGGQLDEDRLPVAGITHVSTLLNGRWRDTRLGSRAIAGTLEYHEYDTTGAQSTIRDAMVRGAPHISLQVGLGRVEYAHPFVHRRRRAHPSLL